MNKTIYTEKPGQHLLIVEREFNAPRSLVWRAWTEAELLDRWWAPAPWKTETIHMDFKVGGHWHYAMVGPKGERHYSRADYKAITTEEAFTAYDGFCDEKGVLNRDLPANNWESSFEDLGRSTKVTTRLTFDSKADMEQIIEMGFKEGFAAAHENLDELLNKLT